MAWRALELDPNNPYAAEYLAILLAEKGRIEESVKISRELAIANPVAIYFQRIYAMTLFEARRYDEAIAAMSTPHRIGPKPYRNLRHTWHRPGREGPLSGS